VEETFLYDSTRYWLEAIRNGPGVTVSEAAATVTLTRLNTPAPLTTPLSASYTTADVTAIARCRRGERG
jgi:hypothetical protein